MSQLAPHRATRTTVRGLAALDSTPPAGTPIRGTVLFLPGYTGSKENVVPILDPLAALGWRMVAVDQPGQFESPGPDDPTAYTVDALGAVAARLGAELDRPHLVGHSFGGLVARAAVLADPAAWRSITLLCSGPASIPAAYPAHVERIERLLAAGGMPAVQADEELMARATRRWPAEPPALREFLRRRFLASSGAGLLGMTIALRSEPDRVAELRATGVPALVAYGVDDDAWSPASQADMAVRLGAAHSVIAGARHSPALENPPATVAVLDAFWGAHA